MEGIVNTGEHSVTLLESLRGLADKTADLRIQCRDGEVFTNLLLLAAASPSLRQLLAEPLDQDWPACLLLPDLGVESCRVVLTLLHLQHPAKQAESVSELLDTMELLMIETGVLQRQSGLDMKGDFEDYIKEELPSPTEPSSPHVSEAKPGKSSTDPLDLSDLGGSRHAAASRTPRQRRTKAAAAAARVETDGDICPMCYKTFSSTATKDTHLASHQFTSYGERLHCRVSTCTFSAHIGQDNLRRSLVRHEASHKCRGCRRLIADRRDLEVCQSSHLFTYQKDEKQYRFLCRVAGCGFGHHERRKALIHERAKHRPDFILPGINTPLKSEYAPRPVVCDICSKQVGHRNIQAHMAKHTGEKPFVCDICAYRTYSKAYFRHHMRAKHTELDRFACEVCNKRLQTKIALSHHRMIHTGEKPHVCDHCGKSYRHLVDLKKHAYIHLGGGQEKCPVCGKSFVEKRRLNQHIVQHHTTNRPHRCDSCGSAFASRKGLLKHTRTHSTERPFVCPTCSQAYKTRSHLSKHERSHQQQQQQAPVKASSWLAASAAAATM